MADIFANVIRPALDIFFIALLIYLSYRILARTRAVQLLRGAIAVILLYALAFFLQLETLLWIMNFLAPSIVVALAVIFQPELRLMFTRLGQQPLLNFGRRAPQIEIKAIVDVSQHLARKKRGALMVIMRSVGLSNIIATGTILDAALSTELLLTIFETNTHLHDGAVIISGDKIIAAGCLLPLSSQRGRKKSYGTRHKAALGLAEESDAIVVVVSEERRWVSLAYNSAVYENLSTTELSQQLQEQLSAPQREDS